MIKKIILLDARIVGVIDKRAFYTLRNDHCFVAFIEKGKCFKAIKSYDEIRLNFHHLI